MKNYLKKILVNMLQKYNYTIVANNFHDWTKEDEEFKEIFNLQKDFCWNDDTGPKIRRMYQVRNILHSVKGIKGEWAECGTFKGSMALLMAEYASRYNLLDDNSNIHLFDSFDGLAKPSIEDMGTNMIEGDYTGTLDEVKNNLASYDSVKYYKGWIPDRFNEVEDKLFSFVHIDLDFYEPIRDSLNFFIPRMSSGGVILLDDYACFETPGALKALEESVEKTDIEISRLPFGHGYITVR